MLREAVPGLFKNVLKISLSGYWSVNLTSQQL